jgi:hypothetical protein
MPSLTFTNILCAYFEYFRSKTKENLLSASVRSSVRPSVRPSASSSFDLHPREGPSSRRHGRVARRRTTSLQARSSIPEGIDKSFASFFILFDLEIMIRLGWFLIQNYYFGIHKCVIWVSKSLFPPIKNIILEFTNVLYECQNRYFHPSKILFWNSQMCYMSVKIVISTKQNFFLEFTYLLYECQNRYFHPSKIFFGNYKLFTTVLYECHNRYFHPSKILFWNTQMCYMTVKIVISTHQNYFSGIHKCVIWVSKSLFPPIKNIFGNYKLFTTVLNECQYRYFHPSKVLFRNSQTCYMSVKIVISTNQNYYFGIHKWAEDGADGIF